MPIDVLVGGQFGSEGKGGLLAKLLVDLPERQQYDFHVRVGAANAGHTGYDLDGKKHVALQLPLACHMPSYWPGHKQVGVIGPGALISLDILERELEEVWSNGNKPTVFVDEKAHVIMGWHKDREEDAGLEDTIGSTSTIAKEGIGQAEISRVARKYEDVITVKQVKERFLTLGCSVMNTADLLNWRLRHDNIKILIEGTQGWGLSVIHGHWPYVTSRDTTTAALLSQTGLPPRLLRRVFGVYRTYPIRVHGNSGPFEEDSQEVTWEDLGLEPERTTVTKRIRRIATFSYEQFIRSLRMNGVDVVCLTFWDYMDPEADAELTALEKSGTEEDSPYIPPEGQARELLTGILEALQETTAKLAYVACGPSPNQVHPVRPDWLNTEPVLFPAEGRRMPW